MEDGAGEYMLLQYSTDLTEKAMLGKLDPMIGRESEMERLMQILCRRTKNNPCLIGDPGLVKQRSLKALHKGSPKAICQEFLRIRGFCH